MKILTENINALNVDSLGKLYESSDFSWRERF